MATLFTTICLLFLVMETLVGMVANGSIVLINYIDWFKSRKLSPTDLILTCLGLSRLLLLALVIPAVTVKILLKSTVSNVLFPLMSMWIFTDTVNLWFAACLSVFYLAKIAIFSHPVFLELKRRFSGLVPWLLLGSVVYSAVVTVIISASWNYGLYTCNPYKALLSNRSNAEMNMPHECKHINALNYASRFGPFMAFLSSSIFLISSLWKHMRRVQRNGTGTRDLSTQAHLSALKALASFAVLYLVSFAGFYIEAILFRNKQQTWVIMLYNMSAVYPSGHAIILILMNPKLKEAWIRMVRRLKCRLSKVPS